jgi:hypothetical protein
MQLTPRALNFCNPHPGQNGIDFLNPSPFAMLTMITIQVGQLFDDIAPDENANTPDGFLEQFIEETGPGIRATRHNTQSMIL